MRKQKQTQLLLKPEMVNVTLAELKLQTRRLNGLELINEQPDNWHYDGHIFVGSHLVDNQVQVVIPECPYGQVGDLLWVRENWQHSNFPYGPCDEDCIFYYMADFLDDPLGVRLEKSQDGIRRTWKPSIHMPKYACRLWLEIRKIRIERLHDITDAGAILEGTYRHIDTSHTFNLGIRSLDGAQAFLLPGIPRIDFLNLFASIHGEALVRSNPWVWVINFEKVEAPL